MRGPGGRGIKQYRVDDDGLYLKRPLTLEYNGTFKSGKRSGESDGNLNR